MIPNIELAWAAGFFEGEGSVRINAVPSTRSLGTLSVEISQVDREPLAWIADRWPGTLHFVQPRSTNGRPFYRWVRLTVHAVTFLRDIEPFLVRSAVREKVRIGIAFQEQKLRTHANRTPEYRARQKEFVDKMTVLNRRGLTEIERTALAARVRTND